MRIIKEYPFVADTTFGALRFVMLRRTVHETDGDGNIGPIKHRVYNMKSPGMGKMVQVSIPPDVPEKTFPPGTVVKLVNPISFSITDATFNTIDTNRFYRAVDIVPVGKTASGNNVQEPSPPPGKPSDKKQDNEHK